MLPRTASSNQYLPSQKVQQLWMRALGVPVLGDRGSWCMLQVPCMRCRSTIDPWDCRLSRQPAIRQRGSPDSSPPASLLIHWTLRAFGASFYVFIWALLRFTRDAREPPTVQNAIPFLSPVISMGTKGSAFHRHLRQDSEPHDPGSRHEH
ncbi:hypothetical protein F4780DRAFT_150718 [Xylariomycetidae sp. FL0641]|nr:hypothetical protein F4780DRAFT_150718 [Xylariomycetidae sp. FL0641]